MATPCEPQHHDVERERGSVGHRGSGPVCGSSSRCSRFSLVKSVLVVAIIVAAACTQVAEASDDDYLWSFQQVGGVAGPKFRMKVSASARSWFKHLVNAETQIMSGSLDDAVESYTTILEHFQLPDKEAQEIHLALGQVLTNMSLLDQAEKSFQQAASIRADSHLPHYFLGVVHTKQGQFQAALSAYETALFFDPTFIPAVLNIGCLYVILGNMDQALYYFKAALDRMRESHAEDLAVAEKDVQLEYVLPRLVNHVLKCFSEVRGADQEYGEVAATIQAYVKHVSRLDLALMHLNLGFRLQNVGAFEIGLSQLKQTLILQPIESWIRLYILLAMPLVHDSEADIDASLTTLRRDVTEALEDVMTISRPERLRELYHLTYMLPFMGRPTKDLMASIARVFANSFPRIDVVPPELNSRYGMVPRLSSPPPSPTSPPPSPSAPASAVVHVGILSYQLHDSPVGHLLAALVRRLSLYDGTQCDPPGLSFGGGSGNGWPSFKGVSKFHITVILPRPYGDSVTRAILDDSDRLVKLPDRTRDPEVARRMILENQLDVLIAADPGIDPFMYTLLHSRLAPVQIVYWSGGGSHTLSLGLPNTVDYYVTGDSPAPDDMWEEMNEQIVRLGDIGVFFASIPALTRSDIFEVVARHSIFGSRTLYLVPRLLISIHPSFDEVIGAILSRDPTGEVMILHEKPQELWLERIRRRLRRSPHTAAVARRIRFTKQQAQRDFFALASAADVVLDTFPVGLGVGALEILSLGTPIVTLPSKQPMRQVAAAALRRLNLTELVANDLPSMVDTAVRIGTNITLRVALSDTIRSRRSALELDDERSETGFFYGANVREDREVAEILESDNPRLTEETRAYFEELTRQGFGDPFVSVMNDWVGFIARTGHPWAVLREQHSDPSAGLTGQSDKDQKLSGKRGSGSKDESGRKRKVSRRTK